MRRKLATPPDRSGLTVDRGRGKDRHVDVDVVVEIPKGSRNKYERDPQSDRIRLERCLFTATGYPGDYGLVPDTLAEDGDPIDVLLILDEPTFPGCVVRARIHAAVWMRSQAVPDH